ncbi:MAG: C45 family peptidase [Armatimonadota bacterium]|nr:C45 family peptidase [Armatimonadota bacterium]MDR7428247.1 C45 family peptidase [Armatimonadota bacterium]MDR7463219.1 C45 family peptidase [Armatimonadota bacterium]MDR7469401.1 C45 family peptidase [Armatimonadota bacterium]MDR7474763.1 C45 family peptidase [Armatimonadota bacterium]
MSVQALPVLTLRGNPRQQGRQHGEGLREAVAHNVEVYLRRFLTDGRLTRQEVERRAAAYLDVFTGESPQYREAMEGIAEASGRTLLEIAMLNARYEILYSAYSAIGMAEAAGGCTAFAASRAVTADGHLWIGQTWDWIPGVRGALLDLEEDGLRILAFTEAGIAGGKIGMNAAGVGLVVNGLLSNLDDWARLGVPFHLRTAGILHSRTLAEAVTRATEGVHACSANFLVARGGGAGRDGAEEVVDLETSPAGWVAHTPVGGTLAHANHFLQPQRLAIWQPLREERSSTYLRCQRMAHLLAERAATGPLTVSDLEALLADHHGRPDSICRHPNPRLPQEERSETVFAVLMDLDALEMRYAAGAPCTAPFRSRSLL